MSDILKSQLVGPADKSFHVTDYRDSMSTLRTVRIHLQQPCLTHDEIKIFELHTTIGLSLFGIYIHIPTGLLIVHCEKKKSFAIRKVSSELQDVINRSLRNDLYLEGGLKENIHFIDLDLEEDPSSELQSVESDSTKEEITKQAPIFQATVESSTQSQVQIPNTLEQSNDSKESGSSSNSQNSLPSPESLRSSPVSEQSERDVIATSTQLAQLETLNDEQNESQSEEKASASEAHKIIIQPYVPNKRSTVPEPSGSELKFNDDTTIEADNEEEEEGTDNDDDGADSDSGIGEDTETMQPLIWQDIVQEIEKEELKLGISVPQELSISDITKYGKPIPLLPIYFGYVKIINGVQSVVAINFANKNYEHIINDNLGSLILFQRVYSVLDSYILKVNLYNKYGEELPDINYVVKTMYEMPPSKTMQDNALDITTYISSWYSEYENNPFPIKRQLISDKVLNAPRRPKRSFKERAGRVKISIPPPVPIDGRKESDISITEPIVGTGSPTKSKFLSTATRRIPKKIHIEVPPPISLQNTSIPEPIPSQKSPHKDLTPLKFTPIRIKIPSQDPPVVEKKVSQNSTPRKINITPLASPSSKVAPNKQQGPILQTTELQEPALERPLEQQQEQPTYNSTEVQKSQLEQQQEQDDPNTKQSELEKDEEDAIDLTQHIVDLTHASNNVPDPGLDSNDLHSRKSVINNDANSEFNDDYSDELYVLTAARDMLRDSYEGSDPVTMNVNKQSARESESLPIPSLNPQKSSNKTTKKIELKTISTPSQSIRKEPQKFAQDNNGLGGIVNRTRSKANENMADKITSSSPLESDDDYAHSERPLRTSRPPGPAGPPTSEYDSTSDDSDSVGEGSSSIRPFALSSESEPYNGDRPETSNSSTGKALRSPLFVNITETEESESSETVYADSAAKERAKRRKLVIIRQGSSRKGPGQESSSNQQHARSRKGQLSENSRESSGHDDSGGESNNALFYGPGDDEKVH